MSDLKKEMLKIKVKGYFDNGDLRTDPTIWENLLNRGLINKCSIKLNNATGGF